MKSWYFFIGIFILFSCGDLENKNNNLIISGNVISTSSGLIFLEKLVPEGYEKMDSTKAGKDRSFAFQIPKGKPEIYRINFFGIQQNHIVLDSQDISITASGKLRQGNFLATGSTELEILRKVNEESNQFDLEKSLFRQRLLNLSSKNDSVKIKPLEAEFMDREREFYGFLTNSIKELNGHLAAWLILTEHFDIEQNLDFYEDQLKLFEKSIPDSWQLNLLTSRYQDIKKLAIGSVAPDFSLPNPDGELIRLSSFRGKYIFLDFWASWCQPCRVENPELVQVYDKFKGEDFEILGVSFDKKKENWLKAISQDELEWKHVSDLKYFDSELIELYNITNVPTTLLLDPGGVIIAKNIHADGLAKILQYKP